ncbi:MAG: hypothetical protein ACI8QS_003554 [Planctomycetota bacterium]|jgi:hypothetical protein
MKGLRVKPSWDRCSCLIDETVHALAPAIAIALASCLCSGAGRAQQQRPSSPVESLSGSSAQSLDSEGATTAVVFIESATQRVYMSISNDGTLSWSLPTRVDQDPFGVPKTLATGAVQVRAGKVHVAWIEAPVAGADSVHVRRSGDGGFLFDPEAVLTSGGEVSSAVLAVQEDTPFDDVHVLYRSDSGSGMHELHLASSDPGSAGTFLATTVVRATSGSDVEGMDLGVAGDSLHVAWVDDRNGDDDLWYRRSASRGTTWIEPTDARLDSGGIAGANVLGDPRVIGIPSSWGGSGGLIQIDPVSLGQIAGAVWISWREDATTSAKPELRSTYSATAGASFGAIVPVGGYTAGVNSVASFSAELSATQGFLLAWGDDRIGSAQVFAARSVTSASTWVSETMLSSQPAMRPRTTFHNDGTAAVAWLEPGVPDDLVGGAYSLDAGATWSPPLVVSDSAGSAVQPEVVYNPACANVIQTWLDDGGGPPNVTGGGYLVGSCSCFFVSNTGPSGCSNRAYVPAFLGSGHPQQRLTVFYPDKSIFTKPAGGWPVLLYSPAGAFAEAAPLGISASAITGICGEPPGVSNMATGIGLKLLNDALQSGWAVITVGTIGWNSEPVGSYAPNLFFDQTSPLWNTGLAYCGEQEFTWARQYVGLYANADDPNGCPALGIDNDKVVVCGTSTGGIYSAFVALGPDRADLGSSTPQFQESTRCAGVILFETPTWFPAYDLDLPGLHWSDSSNPTDASRQLADADPGDLVASSISHWIRDPASMSVDTPAFLAFDEALQDPDFSRSSTCEIDPAANDPGLADSLNTQVHDSWFGLIATEDLACIASSFHGDQSRLWMSSSVDLTGTPADQAILPAGFFSGAVQGDELQGKALEWLVGPRATTLLRNDVGTTTNFNPLCYETVSAPVLCGTWRARVDVSGHAGASLTALLTYPSVFVTPVPYLGFAIFVDISMTPLATSFVTPTGDDALHENEIPGDPSLAGLTVYSQAAVLGGGLEICNAIDLVLGN